MRSLTTVTAATIAACLWFASVAAAADPIRTVTINQRFNGKTYKGTVKYPWPARWNKKITTKNGHHYYAEDLGSGCTARVWIYEVLKAEFDATIAFDMWTWNVTPLASGTTTAGPWMTAAGQLFTNYGATPVANHWVLIGQAIAKLKTNRYLMHSSWNDFYGTCTSSQLTASGTALSLIAAVRDVAVNIKIS